MSVAASPVSELDLLRLVQAGDVPEFVKDASREDLLIPPSESYRYFLDTDLSFPCHTAAATVLSAMRYAEKRAEYSPTTQRRLDGRLGTLAAHFKVANLVGRILTTKAAATVVPSDNDNDYALVGDDIPGGRTLPIGSEAEVKVAASWFVQHQDEIRQQLPWTHRKQAAEKILARAAEYRLDISEQQHELEKIAGRGFTSPKKMAAMLIGRAAQPQLDVETKMMLCKIAGNIEARSRHLVDLPTRVKLAELVDTVDRQFRLMEHYGDTLSAPEEMFAATHSQVKQACDEACELTSGTLYTPEQFSVLKLADVSAALGEEVADSVRSGFQVSPEKMATIARTLPLGDAKLLDMLMSQARQEPIMKRSEAVKTLPSLDAVLSGV